MRGVGVWCVWGVCVCGVCGVRVWGVCVGCVCYGRGVNVSVYNYGEWGM